MAFILSMRVATSRRPIHRCFTTFHPLPSSSSSSPRPPHDPDPNLTSAARAAANASSFRTSPGSGPNLGPFAMPRGPEGERALGQEEVRRWTEAGWGERGKRVVRGVRNSVVIVVGGTLGVLVIYSIVSELAGSTSPTNLMSSLSTHLSTSPSLLTILHPPLSFHGGSSATASTKLRRHRGPTQSIEVDPSTKREVMRVRFWVEGTSGEPDADRGKGWWRDLGWWKAVPRRLVGPLITSEAPPPAPPTRDEVLSAREKAAREQDEEAKRGQQGGVWGSWLTGVFGGLMPRTMNARKEGGQDRARRGWFDAKPPLGKYRSGEVTAELVKDPGGVWTYRAFFVDFPDAHVRHYRLDVLDELRSSQAQDRQQGQQQGPTRYRFWTRKVLAGS